ncbi:hypothetical protein CHRYSEO8AT_820002 [Chryseobacterium sp. 8AT]|nr:hypothetical protein CHRYSEO8AT_820002 [Chryseobacterium sp. 8AT]
MSYKFINFVSLRIVGVTKIAYCVHGTHFLSYQLIHIIW